LKNDLGYVMKLDFRKLSCLTWSRGQLFRLAQLILLQK